MNVELAHKITYVGSYAYRTLSDIDRRVGDKVAELSKAVNHKIVVEGACVEVFVAEHNAGGEIMIIAGSTILGRSTLQNKYPLYGYFAMDAAFEEARKKLVG